MTIRKVCETLVKNSPYTKYIYKKFILPNGLADEFYIEKSQDSVEVFVMTEMEDVIVVKQFRANTEAFQYELPGGGIEDGEQPISACVREVKEETNHEGEIISLGYKYYSPYSVGKRHMFACINAKRTEVKLDLDPNEITLKCEKMSFNKFAELVKTGDIRGWETALLALTKIGRLKIY